MSFMRTLASVAVGFAAAKGVETYNRMGGMSGLKGMMDGGGAGNPMADMMGKMMGGGGDGANPMAAMMGGATNPMAEMMGQMGLGGGGAAAGTSANPLGAMMTDNPMAQAMQKMMGGGTDPAAGMAGIGGLMAAMTGAARSAGQGADDMAQAFFAGTPASVAMEENAKMMIRAMIQAAKADGEIDAQERARILSELDDVSEEERAFVTAELEAAPDPTRLATEAGEGVKAQIYAAALMAIKVDTRAEVSYLDDLARVLDLAPATRDRLHSSMGV